ncbi:MAG: GNAT family protein [Dehalococcoidia bacterium]
MLEGKLVKLRARELADVDRAYAWINDREVTRHLIARYPLSRADEEQWLKNTPTNSVGNGVALAIETQDGTHIGNIDLHPVASEDRHAALGVMIGEKDYWSKGYGTDAIVTLLRFAFDEMNLNRVWLTVDDRNERARACYRKCGFREEARWRQDRFTEGAYHDTLVMGVRRDEFAALHNNGTIAEEGGHHAGR